MLQSTNAAPAGVYRRTRFLFLVAAFFLATNLYSQVEASSSFAPTSTTAWGVGAPALAPTSPPTDSSKRRKKKPAKKRRTSTAKGGRKLDGFEKSSILSEPSESSAVRVSGSNKVGHKKKKLQKKKSKHHTLKKTAFVTQDPLAGRRSVAELTKPASGVKHMKKVKKYKSKTRGASSVVNRIGPDASVLKMEQPSRASSSTERVHKKKKAKKSHKTSSSKARLEKGSSTSPKSQLLGSSEPRSLGTKKTKKKQRVKGETVAVSDDQVKSRKKKIHKKKKKLTGVADARSELPGDADSAIKSSRTSGVSRKKKKTKGKRKHSTQTKVQTDAGAPGDESQSVVEELPGDADSAIKSSSTSGVSRKKKKTKGKRKRSTQTKVQTDAEAPGDEGQSVVEVSPVIGDSDADRGDGEVMEDKELDDTEISAPIQISVEAEPQDGESLELPGDADSAIKSSSTSGVSRKKKKTKGKRKRSTQTKVQTDAEAPGDEGQSVVEVSPVIGDSDADRGDGEVMEDKELDDTEISAPIQISVEAEPHDGESLENIDSTARLDVVVEDAGAILPQTEDLEVKDLEVEMQAEVNAEVIVIEKEIEPTEESEAAEDRQPKEGESTIGRDAAEVEEVESETEGDSSKADETPCLDDATVSSDGSFSPIEIEEEAVEVAENEIARSIEASVVGNDDTTEPEIQNVGQAMEESDKSDSVDAFVGDEYEPSLLETHVTTAQQSADLVNTPVEVIADEVSTDESESENGTAAEEYEPSLLESHAKQKTAEEPVSEDLAKSAEPTSETQGAGEGTNTGMDNHVSSGLRDNLSEDTDEPDILTFIGKILNEDVRSWVEEPEEDDTSDENELPQPTVSSEKDISEGFAAKKLESVESVGNQVNADTEDTDYKEFLVSDEETDEDSEEDEGSDGEEEEDVSVRHTASPNYAPTVSTSAAPVVSPHVSIEKEVGSSTKLSSDETVENVADDSKNNVDEAGPDDAVASDTKSLAVDDIDERPTSFDESVDTEVSEPSEPKARIDRSSLESSEDRKTDIAVSVVTWNLAEESPAESDATFIRKFRASGIHHGTGSDLVLISGQECENIKPRRTEGSRSREFRRLMIKMLGKQYVPIALHLLGGIQFGLFAKKSFLKEIEFVGLSDVTCGIGNVFHNKGAIAAFVHVKARNPSSEKDKKNDGSARSKSLRIMFVTAHMAAHVKNSDARDSDFWRISSELEAQAPERIFPLYSVTKSGTDTGSPLFDSMDRVFFCGDLNYRVDLPRELTEHAVSQIADSSGEVAEELRLDLLRHDQLIRSMAERRAFPGFAEGKITFAPTFKFDKGTDEYDTSHKQRIPAWTDRILFKPLGTRVLEYSSVEDAQHSDHRPVYGTFRVSMEGRQVPKQKPKQKRKKSKRVSPE